MDNTNQMRCGQCGSLLVLMDTITEHREGERTSITLHTYRCTNQSCQDRIDKETADRIKSRAEREKAKIQRQPFNRKKVEATQKV